MRTPPRINHKRNTALSISERTEIVKQHKSGVSVTQLHKNFGRDRRTIRKFINLSKQGNELSSPLKSGRPKPSKRFVSKVKSIVNKENTKEEGCLTYNLVHDQLKRKGYNCSIKKVFRVLHNSGYTRMAKVRNCDLTERHKALESVEFHQFCSQTYANSYSDQWGALRILILLPFFSFYH